MEYLHNHRKISNIVAACKVYVSEASDLLEEEENASFTILYLLNLNEHMSFTSKLLKGSRVLGFVDQVWTGFSAMATNEKVSKLQKKIGTHSGVFHCDEALACFMLKQLPTYQNAEIIRTRDDEILNTCDIVVDVGGVYNPKTHRYDHHQREFKETLSSVRPDLAKNKSIRLSSAGLIYAHFGLDVIREVLMQNDLDVVRECLYGMHAYIYDIFVEELDAIDNGVPMYPEGKPAYRINTHLSARVHRLNPEWNTPTEDSVDELFKEAMDLVGREFIDRVLEAALVWWPAREIVKKSLENRTSVHPSGNIFILEERCPWKNHLYALEEELGIVGQVKFCIFHDTGDSWRVQGIPLQPDSFICRVFLHKNWRGVRDQELSETAKIKDCTFCHATGFIGGNKTKEGALEMALASLKESLADTE